MQAYCENYVQTPDGALLWYARFGPSHAPAFLSCDGLGCSGFAWKYLIQHLVPEFQFIRWNYRGHGRSAPSDAANAYSIETAAEDLWRIQEVNRIDQALLIGHSLGTQVALECHRHHPEGAMALVSLCGTYEFPLNGIHDSALLKDAFPALLHLAEHFPEGSRHIAQALFPSEFAYRYALWGEVNRHLIRRRDFEPYFNHLAQLDPLIFLRMLESAEKHSCRDFLPAIRIPALIAAAEGDRFVPPRISQQMHTAIPGSDFALLRAATHAAVIEQPETLARLIRLFLKKRLGLSKAMPHAEVKGAL